MTRQEAKAKVAGLRQIVLDTYEKEIRNHPYFRDLRAGTLEKDHLKFWIKNWHAFRSKSTPREWQPSTSVRRFFKRHPDEDIVAPKIAEKFTTPPSRPRPLPISSWEAWA